MIKRLSTLGTQKKEEWPDVTDEEEDEEEKPHTNTSDLDTDGDDDNRHITLGDVLVTMQDGRPRILSVKWSNSRMPLIGKFVLGEFDEKTSRVLLD